MCSAVDGFIGALLPALLLYNEECKAAQKQKETKSKTSDTEDKQ